jgi:hypothetical protein
MAELKPVKQLSRVEHCTRHAFPMKTDITRSKLKRIRQNNPVLFKLGALISLNH